MVNDPTLSHSLAEHKKTTIYDVGNPSPCFGQAEKCVKVKVANGILISNININKWLKKNCTNSLFSLKLCIRYILVDRAHLFLWSVFFFI